MAQNQMGKSLGNFVRLEKNKQSITFQTTYGTARVVVFSSSMIKVSVWNHNQEHLPSYAVVMPPEKTSFTFREYKNYFTLKTDSLELQVSKSPLRFTFKTPDGKVINEDDGFGTYWLDGKMFTFKKLFPDEKFIGLGEKTGNLNRRGSDYTNWNTDNPHYEDWSDPLYSTIPFYIGIHDQLPYGIFVDNSTKSNFNFGAGNNRFAYFSVDDHQTDYYFIFHHHIGNIIKEFYFRHY
jgi:alpha-glucosidase